jgi:glycosyltransferase involved in cell wall biosynthesis
MEKSTFPTMVYFGGMRKYKRPEESVYLLKNLIGEIEGLKLINVGTGTQLTKVEDLVKELKIQDYVTFTGRLDEKELSSIVASSWLSIHASVTEGWRYSILEASFAGTPAVAYNLQSVVDAIENV